MISGEDLPKADDFAVASAVQLTQKNRERREKNPKPKYCVPGSLQGEAMHEKEQELAKLCKEKVKLRAWSGLLGK